MISYTPATPPLYPADSAINASAIAATLESNLLESSPSSVRRQRFWLFLASVFLVSVPVFIQAPLVRAIPFISLLVTVALFIGGRKLLAQSRTQVWGDLMIGFTWTWLAGSVYWGWLRWEPFLHLPVEAIGLPFAVWGIARSQGKIGNFFYLGSLIGTVLTDLFFYLVDLIPFWRTLMISSEAEVRPIFQGAIALIQTPWGMGWAATLVILLLVIGLVPLRSHQLHWWAFSGAVLSTILVDGLFWLAACTA